jgi:hypothetical protein
VAHFAELDNANKVLRVVVISNNDVDDNGGDLHEDAETFVENLLFYSSGGVVWKQTSYNNNFRKRFAGIGYTYDTTKDKFIDFQPFDSWSLSNDGDWEAPVTRPNDTEEGGLFVNTDWDEDNQRWLGFTYSSSLPYTETQYVWDAINLTWSEI